MAAHLELLYNQRRMQVGTLAAKVKKHKTQKWDPQSRGEELSGVCRQENFISKQPGAS